jgi:hypothetical protein
MCSRRSGVTLIHVVQNGIEVLREAKYFAQDIAIRNHVIYPPFYDSDSRVGKFETDGLVLSKMSSSSRSRSLRERDWREKRQ